jgi:hypothetical protein
MKSFKLLGIRFSYKQQRDVPLNFKIYHTDDFEKRKRTDHIWYMTYSKYSDEWVVKGLKFVTVLLHRKPVKLVFNGCDKNIKYLSTDKTFVQSKANSYNSYNKALA